MSSTASVNIRATAECRGGRTLYTRVLRLLSLKKLTCVLLCAHFTVDLGRDGIACKCCRLAWSCHHKVRTAGGGEQRGNVQGACQKSP